MKITVLNKALYGLVWCRKNYRKKLTDHPHCHITHTAHVLCQNQQINRGVCERLLTSNGQACIYMYIHCIYLYGIHVQHGREKVNEDRCADRPS